MVSPSGLCMQKETNKQATESRTTKGDRKELAHKKWIEIKLQVMRSDLDGLESRLVKPGEQSPDPLVLEHLLPRPQPCSSGIGARLGRCQCSGGGREGEQEHQQVEQGNKVEATARSHGPFCSRSCLSASSREHTMGKHKQCQQ